MSNHPLHGTLRSGRCPECDHLAPVGEVIKCSRCDCPRHTASPAEPQTPPEAEAVLQAYSDQLDEAVLKLQDARNAELEAEEARDAAKWAATLSPDCPKVGVFDGVRTTVAMQTAWVDDRTAAEERAFRLARARREAAEKYLSVVGKQMSALQSINRSVAASYQGTGGGRW